MTKILTGIKNIIFYNTLNINSLKKFLLTYFNIFLYG